MNMIKKFWNTISFLGLSDKSTDEITLYYKEIVLMNRLTIVLIGVIFLYLPIEIIFNGLSLVPIIIGETILFGITLYFNAIKKFEVAKYYFLLLSFLIVGPMPLLVPKGASNEYFLLPVSIIGFLLFSQKWKGAVVWILAVAIFYLIIYLRDSIPPLVQIDQSVIEFFSPILVFIVFIMLFFEVFYFRSLNDSFQKFILEQQNKIEERNRQISLKNKEMIDSINYARRIQDTMLAQEELLKTQLPSSFVYYLPKDIVSGDFYWACKKNNTFYLAVCDSTGHGVPGAFMSIMNMNLLKEAIVEKNISDTGEVFNYVREQLIQNLGGEAGQKDGFDGVLICYESSSNHILYSAANNAPVLVTSSNGHIKSLNYQRMPVGFGVKKDDFQSYSINLSKGDALYLYTDGFADQFGGPKGKKLMAKNLNQFLAGNSAKNLEEQKINLTTFFHNWKGDLEQIDDICLLGIRF